MQHTVLLSQFCLSVRPSVRLSVRCVYCDKTKYTADILIPHQLAITSLLTPTLFGGRCPIPCQIFAESDPPPLKNADFDRFPLITSQPQESENSSIVTNIKSITSFPTSYRWSAYVTPSPERVAQKRFFCFFLNISQFQSDKVCYKVSLTCVKTSSGKVVVRPFPYLTVHRRWREK